MELLDPLVVEMFQGWSNLEYRAAWVGLAALSFLFQGFRTQHP